MKFALLSFLKTLYYVVIFSVIKGLCLDEREGDEELRRVQGKETKIGVYYVRKHSFFNKRGKATLENGTPTKACILSTSACFYHSQLTILFYFLRQGIVVNSDISPASASCLARIRSIKNHFYTPVFTTRPYLCVYI